MADNQKQLTSIPEHSFIGKHFSMLADISSAAIFEYDLESKDFFLLLNSSQYFGITDQELSTYIQSRGYTSIKDLLQDFLHADDITTALEAHTILYAKRSVRYMARLKHADGTYRWRNIYYSINKEQENGRHIIAGYITDINNTKTHNGLLERFFQSTDSSFVCIDMNTDNYILFGTGDGHSPILGIGSNYSSSLIDFADTSLPPEEREEIVAQMQLARVAKALQSGTLYTVALNLRDPIVGILHKSLKYKYYSKENNLVLVTLDDLTRQVAEELEYFRIIKEAMSLASTDPLTGLYNRHSGEALIRQALERSAGNIHALMLLTIENLDSISKGVGELFGEALLTDVTLRLKRLFRSNDILARVDDTSFMVFMADMPNETYGIHKAEDIQRIIRETCTDSESRNKLTCNLGLVFINGRPDFDTLLHNAQRSLQTATQAGHNTFHVFQEKSPHICSLPAVPETEEHHARLVLQLKERIFDMLYTAPDFEQSIHMALALIGGMLDVSRVYIFENSNDNQTTSNTFEWCNESVSAEIHNLQNLPFSSINYAAQFDANGLFNCPDINATHGIMHDILSMQGIRGLLQVAIKDGNEIIGFVGFDECRLSRAFTATEIDTLSFVAKIIGTFVRKKRMTDLFSAAERDKVEALDNLPSYIYVLDQEHRLLYMNKMVNMLVPSALVGMKCHSALKGLDVPCPGCPAIRCEHGRCSVEMYNPRYNLWVISNAARITWGGRENMTLVSCQDITSFKIMRAMA